jgi:hypothetical protein
MKAQDSNRDELFNSFVDGELSPRQRTEVKRLAAHDQDVAGRIRQIENVRNLLRSLPREDPPDEIADNVRRLLERQSLLGDRDLSVSDRPRRYLILSKLRAVAAVLLLMGALVVLIHNIVSPLDTSGNSGLASSAPEDVTLNGGPAPVETVNSTFQLHLAESTNLAEVLDEAVADHGLSAQVSRQLGDNQEVYRFECEKKDLGQVLTRLQNVWGAVDRARFVMASDSGQEAVVIESADPRTVTRVLDQKTPGSRFRFARQIAADQASRIPSSDGIPPIARPVLTAGTEAPQGTALTFTGEGKVQLTIELIHDSR